MPPTGPPTATPAAAPAAPPAVYNIDFPYPSYRASITSSGASIKSLIISSLCKKETSSSSSFGLGSSEVILASPYRGHFDLLCRIQHHPRRTPCHRPNLSMGSV